MKRIVLSIATVATLVLGGMFSNSAQAHGPGGYCGPRHGYGYGAQTGYSPYNVYRYRAPFVPYGAGYSGGWQPYQGFYSQQPRFGLYLGF